MLEKNITKIKLNNLEERKDFVATIGVFDGLHLGHQHILKNLRKIAFEKNFNSLVITFEEDFFKTTKNISNFILTMEEKEEFLRLLGIDYLFILKISEIKNMLPEEFIKELKEIIPIKYLCVGENFRFGYNRTGDIKTLMKLANVYEFNVKIFPLYSREEIYSSSLIRKLLEDGDIENARKKLGYYYFIKGKVIEGQKVGRRIGFPTANIEVKNKKIIPANGIYRGKVIISDKFYKSAIYIGTKPTFNGDNKTIEIHILDFDGDLVGKEIEIIFEEYIRDEKKFENISQLIKQISKDIEYIREKKDENAIITIDGPAGSGKTTIAKLLAKTLKFNYLDSGALYRAVGWFAKEMGLEKEDEIVNLIKSKPFKWYWNGEEFKIFFRDIDISEIIRRDEIGKEASKVGAMKSVREILTLWQRESLKEKNTGLILEGRDSGTVVFPNANLKLYITANLKVRAERRSRELGEDFEKILNSIKERDLKDSQRLYSPLKIPDDSYIIDTSTLTPKEVISKIISLFLKVR